MAKHLAKKTERFAKKTVHSSPKAQLEAKYNGSIANLLFVVVFTALNTLLLVLNADTYFLFSAFIPYFVADLGMFYTGSYPAEYYDGIGDIPLANPSLLYICIAIAFAVILLYLLCWFLARKKKVGWLVVSVVLFSLDTVIMFLLTGIDTSMIMDILFHAWVIISLISGIVNYNKWKKIPDKVPAAEPETADEQEEEPTVI